MVMMGQVQNIDDCGNFAEVCRRRHEDVSGADHHRGCLSDSWLKSWDWTFSEYTIAARIISVLEPSSA